MEKLVKTLDLNPLVKVAKKKLLVLELDKTLLSSKGNIPDSTWDIVYSLLKKDKQIALISNKYKDLIKKTIENSLRNYLDKYYLSSDMFKDILLYTDGGERKYTFDSFSVEFKEVKEYCKKLSAENIKKIRNLIENNLTNNKRSSINYQKKDFVEEFDIYDLTEEEKKEITKKLKEKKYNSRVLVKAVEQVLHKPKIMVNLAEPPTLYFLLYGLMDITYYARKDPEYKKRLEIVSKIKNLLEKEKISAKVELGGSRGIAIRTKTKADALKDAISTFKVNKDEVAIIMDASELAENSRAMIFDSEINLINVGNKKVNNELYEDYFRGHIGAVAWLVLINLVCSESFKQEDLEFIKKVLITIEDLLIQPEIRSKTIAEHMGINKKELTKIYNFISRYDAFRNLLKYDSKFPSYTIPMFDYIKHKTRIKKIITGKTVYPLIVEVHLGEECNSNCVMCFSHSIEYEEAEHNKKASKENFIPPVNDEMIEKLLIDCKKGKVEEIWFSGGKEPLMSPRVIDTIKKANKIGFVTRLYTNGELLNTEEKRRTVLGCYQIRFSVNGAKNETYDMVHFPGNKKYPCPMHHRKGEKVFERVMENIKELVKLKKKTGSKIKIAISQIIQPLNCDELIDFVNMAYSLGVDSIQIRAESSSTIRTFTEEEKKKIITQIYEINRRKNLGQFSDMEFDLRGVSKEELDAPKSATQFLPGMKKAKLCMAGSFKRGVNPYGKVYNCEFSMHPQNARIEPYKSKRIGDLHKNKFNRVLSNAAGKYPFVCNKPCQAHEYAMNITLEKFMEDYEWGISISDQPYYPSKESKEIALVGLGRWGGGAVLNTLTQCFSNTFVHGVARSNYEEWRNKKDLPKNFKVHSLKKYEEEILTNPDIRAVIITTQFNTHYDLAKQALLAGKDVFVEKPFTQTPEEAEELIRIAKKRGSILAVGYEFMYNPNLNYLRKIIREGNLGEVADIEFNMLNPLEGRKLDTSSNVVQDLASHMLSLVQLLFGKGKVSNFKVDSTREKANISFDYDDIPIKINVDRDYSENERNRTIKIRGTNLYVTLDYQNTRFKIQDANGKVVDSPNVSADKSTLELEFRIFLEAVKHRRNLINSAENTLWISKLIN